MMAKAPTKEITVLFQILAKAKMIRSGDEHIGQDKKKIIVGKGFQIKAAKTIGINPTKQWGRYRTQRQLQEKHPARESWTVGGPHKIFRRNNLISLEGVLNKISLNSLLKSLKAALL